MSSAVTEREQQFYDKIFAQACAGTLSLDTYNEMIERLRSLPFGATAPWLRKFSREQWDAVLVACHPGFEMTDWVDPATGVAPPMGPTGSPMGTAGGGWPQSETGAPLMPATAPSGAPSVDRTSLIVWVVVGVGVVGLSAIVFARLRGGARRGKRR